MPLDNLRRVIAHNQNLVERLFEAQARCDPDALRVLLSELDLNNADLHVVLEELTAYPPTPATTSTPPAAGGGEADG